MAPPQELELECHDQRDQKSSNLPVGIFNINAIFYILRGRPGTKQSELPLLELAFVLVRFDHVASGIINAESKAPMKRIVEVVGGLAGPLIFAAILGYFMYTYASPAFWDLAKRLLAVVLIIGVLWFCSIVFFGNRKR